MAIALELAEKGYQVAIAGVDEVAAPKALLELRQVGPAKFYACDVGDETQVQALMTQVLEDFGTIDALVCNAGLADPENPPVEDFPLERWERVIRVNLTGTFLCVKHATRALRESRGAVVIISSTRAHASEPHTEAYTASKAGQLGLTHALANSLSPHIRVNAICPGWIDAQNAGGFSRKEEEIQLVGRVGTGRDIAVLAEFLLDPDRAGYITGQPFTVDGGVLPRLRYDPLG